MHRYFVRGEPVLAAACQLSMGEVDGAVRMLVRGDEPDMALALATCLSASSGVRPGVVLHGGVDYIRVVLARRCEGRGHLGAALQILKDCRRINPTNYIRAMLARLALSLEV